MNDSIERNPAVSVIVPNYNYETYLTDRIETILSQTYQDFELILLDDASTDASVPLMQRYKNKYPSIRIEVNEKNSGSPFQQWMKGIKMARGKWIWIAEADDVSSPHFLQKCLEALERHPQSSACMVGSVYIDSEGHRIDRRVNYWDRRGMKRYRNVESRFIEGEIYAKHKVYWSCPVANTSATVFAREAALELEKSPFLGMRSSGDWLFWFQMIMAGGMVEIYEDLNYFRIHTNKVTVKAGKTGLALKEDIEIVAYMEGILKDIGPYRKSLCHGMLWQRIKNAPAAPDIKEKCWQLLYEKTGATKKDYTRLLWNKYLRFIHPFLLTFERDRKVIE